MAANFIELQEEQGNAENITTQEETTSLEPTQEVDNPEPEVKQEPEVPEKYRGKSLEDIVKMHQESEKLIGRQAQEVGESRKLLDQFIKQQLEQKHDTQQPSKAQEIDWFEDPAKAVNQAVENNPILKQLQEQQAQQAQVVAQQAIEKAHPDYLDVAASEDFAQWVQGSKIRMGLYAKASNFDVDSAMELLETYKSLRNIKTQKAEQTKAADETLKKADDESRSKALKTAAVQQGGTGESTKPIYRRADLIRLRMQDPSRYESMADDILQAYAEGRVR